MTNRRRLWLALLLVYGGAIFAFSSFDVGGGEPLVPHPVGDKLLHAMQYAVFYVLCWKAAGQRTALALALTVLYAGIDELHQVFVPGRSGGIDDVCADVAGACIAAASIRRMQRGLLLMRKPQRILRRHFPGKRG